MAEAKFSNDDKTRIVNAIVKAENKTSGEIRVHIESKCKGGDPLIRAKSVFEKLKMHKTELRNGVLFYISTEDRKFAILGDKGIDSVTPEDFWDEIKSNMISHLKNEDIVSALETGIQMAGDALKKEFPIQENDENELSDEISFGQ